VIERGVIDIEGVERSLDARIPTTEGLVADRGREGGPPGGHVAAAALRLAEPTALGAFASTT